MFYNQNEAPGLLALERGDCLELMKALPDKSVDLIVTDPPYPTTKRGVGKSTTTGGMFRTENGLKGKMFKHNDIDVSLYAPECYRVLKDGCHFYIMTNHVNLQNILNTCVGVGFHFIKSLIWNKGNKIMGQAYMSQFEYILFFRKGRFKKINNCGTSDILSIPNIKTKGEDGKNLHDTEKPVKLMQILIENSSLKGETVLDPFSGIGSTGVACANTGRQFIGMELDEQYFEIARDRVERAFFKKDRCNHDQ